MIAIQVYIEFIEADLKRLVNNTSSAAPPVYRFNIKPES